MSPPQELRDLPVDAIEPNLSQPRRYFDEEAMDALAASVGERGVLQPVLVRPRKDGSYELVAGERRWRAAKLAGLTTIPALVSAYDDLAALEVGLMENMARQDLNPVEEARACVTLARECGLNYRQIASRVGRGHVTVWNLMHLLDLPVEVLELLERGALSKSHGTALLVASDPRVRSRLAGEAIEQGWSTRTLEARARASNTVEPGNPVQADGVSELISNIARVWGDALGVEVQVRAMGGRKLRVEIPFYSPEGALGLGGKIREEIAKGKKRR
jgi:ParB family chromosome partitioning protein